MAAGTSAAGGRSGARARVATIGAGIVSALVFLWIQARLEAANERDSIAFLRRRGVPLGRVLLHNGVDAALTRSGAPFLALLLATSALVLVGWRWPALAPLGLLVGTPFLLAAVGKYPHGIALLPEPLGSAWHPGVAGGSVATRAWTGTLVDTVLVAAPAFAGFAALRRRDPIRVRLRHDAPVRADNAFSLLACALVVWLVAFTQATADATGAGTAERMIRFAPFVAVGLLLGARRWWCLPVCLAVAMLWGSDWFGNLLVGRELLPSWAQVRDTIPVALVVGTAALRAPLTSLVMSVRDRTRLLLLTTNGLNVADAALTVVALRHGQSAESNPMVRWMGLPAKLVLVAVASALIARFRPRALIWPALALGAVLAWHMSGLVLNGS